MLSLRDRRCLRAKSSAARLSARRGTSLIRPRVLAALLVFVWVTVSSSLSAQFSRKLSGYEEESIAIALRQIGGGKIKHQLEKDPAGKTIEKVEIVSLEVLEPRDPAPTFLNWFHVTSQDYVIRQEVLLEPGQVYDQRLFDETERNLRLKPQLSVVLLVPLKGSTPDKVRILVVAKDVWSLRMSWQPTIDQGKLTYLAMQPSETNLFGTHQLIAANITLTPNNYTLGGTYSFPRMGGSHVNAYLKANAVLNCATSEVEGGFGVFQYGQPLYSTYAKWSWQVAATWSSSLIRPGAGYDENGRTLSICADGMTRNYEHGRTDETRQQITSRSRYVRQHAVVLPYEWRNESLAGQLVLTRSFFTVDKLNLSTGIEVQRDRYSFVEPRIEETQLVRADALVFRSGTKDTVTSRALDPEPGMHEAEYASAINYLRARQIGQRRISPYVQLHAFSNRWRRMINYVSLGLQEDWPMGHDVYLRLYPAFSPLSSHDMLGIFASASYTWPVGSGFAKVLLGGQFEIGRVRESVPRGFDIARSVEWPPDAEPKQKPIVPSSGAAFRDNTYEAGAHFASPHLGLGRFVFDVAAHYRPQYAFNNFLYTGGSGRLRGYKPSEFGGQGIINTNAEFRTSPLQIFAVNTGLVAFFDAGGAFNRTDVDETQVDVSGAQSGSGFDLTGGYSAGLGLRILAPQLDRDVFRIDFGFPLQKERLGEIGFFATFYQAFFPPYAIPPVLLPQ